MKANKSIIIIIYVHVYVCIHVPIFCKILINRRYISTTKFILKQICIDVHTYVHIIHFLIIVNVFICGYVINKEANYIQRMIILKMIFVLFL